MDDRKSIRREFVYACNICGPMVIRLVSSVNANFLRLCSDFWVKGMAECRSHDEIEGNAHMQEVHLFPVLPRLLQTHAMLDPKFLTLRWLTYLCLPYLSPSLNPVILVLISILCFLHLATIPFIASLRDTHQTHIPGHACTCRELYAGCNTIHTTSPIDLGALVVVRFDSEGKSNTITTMNCTSRWTSG